MGFFKKIGGFVKKQVSFRNLVKTVKNFGSFIPVVGGVVSTVVGKLSDAHEAKVAEREQTAQAEQAQTDYNKAMQDAYAQGQSTVQAQETAKNVMVAKNPNIGEILTGAAGGALAGAGGVLAGSSQAGQAGATLVDNTMSVWLKRNWLKLVGGILGAALVIFFFTKMLKGGTRSISRRR